MYNTFICSLMQLNHWQLPEFQYIYIYLFFFRRVTCLFFVFVQIHIQTSLENIIDKQWQIYKV